jgi:hypothetical protein
MSRADGISPRVNQLHVTEDIMSFRALVPQTKGQQLSTGRDAFDPLFTLHREIKRIAINRN